MKNLKKLFAVVIAVAMLVTVMAPAFAAGGAFSYEAEAQVLNDLGLYKGISTTEFVPDLGTALNRETGVVMLLRIFGLEADAEAVTDADATLAKFSDAASISAWAKNAVAYAVENGLVKGYPDGTFGPKLALNGKAYCTLILAQLGYTPDYSNAPAELADKGGLTVLQAVKFTEKDLIKDDLVGISYGTLKAKYSDGTTVIEKLIEANPDLEEAAIAAGLVEEVTITSLASVPAVKAKVGETPELPKTVTATYSDKTTADVAVTWGAVDTTKAGTVTVAGTVEGTDLKASVTVTVEEVLFAVNSVTALNCKQLQVVFNKTLDADSAKTAANYEVKDLGTNVIAATPALQDDNKTVILTLDVNSNGKLTNSSNAKLTVKKDGVKAADDGKALAADYVNDAIKVYDGAIPEITKVEAVGAKTLKLTFNEPVIDNGNDTTLTNTDFAVKSGTYTYYVTNAVADFANHTVTLTLGTSLMAGEVTVTVNANGVDTNSAVRDFANIKAFKGETKFTYAADTSVATVTVKEISQTSVTLKFSKPVYGTAVTLFHSVKGVDAYKKQLTITEGNATDEWKFDFDNKIPQGAVKLYLVNSTVDAEKITDLYGVKVPDTVIDATVTVDVTPPTVSSTELKDNNKYNVTFSEDIDTAEAKDDNFAVKKVSDGSAVSFTVSNDNAKVVTLGFSPVLEDNTAYEITVKAMKDKAGNSMAAQAVYTVTVGDNNPPTVTDAFVVKKGGTDDLIYIVYSEPINAAQMIDKTNYLVDPDGVGAGSGYKALGDDDKVEAVSDRQVKITFHAGVNNPHVTIAPVVDLAGKKIGNNTTIGYNPAKLQSIAAASLTVAKAELIAKNKVKLTFNKELSSFNNTQFQFNDKSNHSAWTYADELKISGIESLVKDDDGNTVATVIIDHDLGTDATYKTKQLEVESIAGSGTATTSVQGIELGVAGNPRVKLDDSCAPEISQVTFISAKKIEVQFSEDLDYSSIANAGKNGFSVAGGTLTKAIKRADVDNVIVLTGTDFTKNTDVTYTAGNITDASANANALATVTKTDELKIGAITLTKLTNATFKVEVNYGIDLSAADSQTVDIKGAKTTAVTDAFGITGLEISANKDFGSDTNVNLAAAVSGNVITITVSASNAGGGAGTVAGDVVVTLKDTNTDYNLSKTITLTESALGTVTVK